MTNGEQVMRLERALAGATEEQVQTAADEWFEGAIMLGLVQGALLRSKPIIAGQFGPDTGDAAANAFQKMADKVSDRQEQMYLASHALTGAKKALADARTVQQSFSSQLNDPGDFRADPDADELDQIRANRAHSAEKAAFSAAFVEREEQARQAADNMDRVYQGSTETMKKVHGEPDRPTGGGGGGHHSGPGPGFIPGPGAGPGFVPDTGNDPDPGVAPPGVAAGVPQGAGETVPTSPISPSPVTSVPTGGPSAGTMGGLAGALGGGLMGGMAGVSGAVRGGGAAVPATTANSSAGAGARAIGSSSRTGASGSLGRSTTTPGLPAPGRVPATAHAAPGVPAARAAAPAQRERAWLASGTRTSRRSRSSSTRSRTGSTTRAAPPA